MQDLYIQVVVYWKECKDDAAIAWVVHLSWYPALLEADYSNTIVHIMACLPAIFTTQNIHMNVL